MRRVRLPDGHKAKASLKKRALEDLELLFILRVERYRVRVGGKIPRARLASGMNRLGDLDPEREVFSHDDVVIQRSFGGNCLALVQRPHSKQPT